MCLGRTLSTGSPRRSLLTKTFVAASAVATHGRLMPAATATEAVASLSFISETTDAGAPVLCARMDLASRRDTQVSRAIYRRLAITVVLAPRYPGLVTWTRKAPARASLAVIVARPVLSARVRRPENLTSAPATG